LEVELAGGAAFMAIESERKNIVQLKKKQHGDRFAFFLPGELNQWRVPIKTKPWWFTFSPEFTGGN
jgi:hypothetical protein